MSKPANSPPHAPEIRRLNAEEQAALEDGLNLAVAPAGAPRPLQTQQIETLYNAILQSGDEAKSHVIALGLAFGEDLIRHGDLEWVRVADEYGEETCVALCGYSIFCRPISMMQKRLARKELPDIAALRQTTIETLQDMINPRIEERD